MQSSFIWSRTRLKIMTAANSMLWSECAFDVMKDYLIAFKIIFNQKTDD